VRTPPKGLEAGGRRFWRDVTGRYELLPQELMLLERAARCLDRQAKVDELICRLQPITVSKTTGMAHANPLYAESAQIDKTPTLLAGRPGSARRGAGAAGCARGLGCVRPEGHGGTASTADDEQWRS